MLKRCTAPLVCDYLVSPLHPIRALALEGQDTDWLRTGRNRPTVEYLLQKRPASDGAIRKTVNDGNGGSGILCQVFSAAAAGLACGTGRTLLRDKSSCHKPA